MDKIETIHAPKAIGPYSQAILANNFLFVSGQLPIDPATGTLVESKIELQIDQVLNNIEAILQAAGISWQQVVKSEIFLQDLNDFAIVNAAYGKRVDQSTPPARQTVQVAKIPLGALVEISCIAIK
jgi:2-iminobutanoate/2-iminopropanoate deaminase